MTSDPVVAIIHFGGPDRLWRRIEETREVRGRVVIIRRRILLNTCVEKILVTAEVGDEAKIAPETIRDGAN